MGHMYHILNMSYSRCSTVIVCHINYKVVTLFSVFSHYHSIHSTSGESSKSQNQKDNPIETLSTVKPAICFTIAPGFASVTTFHIACGMHFRSGTQTKHALGPSLFPYSFVTSKDNDGDGLILNS